MYNILIIDDQNDVADVLGKMLSRFGHTVEVAPGGYKGISMFDEGDFDLVITDVLMPGIDGHDIARHIRSSRRSFTPIIGISGTPWLLENSEFDRILSKPFGLKILLDSVSAVMSYAVLPHRDGWPTALSAR